MGSITGRMEDGQLGHMGVKGIHWGCGETLRSRQERRESYRITVTVDRETSD